MSQGKLKKNTSSLAKKMKKGKTVGPASKNKLGRIMKKGGGNQGKVKLKGTLAIQTKKLQKKMTSKINKNIENIMAARVSSLGQGLRIVKGDQASKKK